MKMKLVLFVVLSFCFIYVNNVFALKIETPVINSVSYVDENSVAINYSTNNDNSDYKVQIYNMTLGKFENDSVTSSSHTLSNLTVGKTYNIIMRVYYGTTVSNWSNVISATPKMGVPTLSSVNSADKSLILKYTTNGTPKSVEIYNSVTKSSVSTTNLTTYTVTGLINETSYSFLIRNCYDVNVCSSWSNIMSGTPKYVAPTPKTISASTAIVDKAKELAWPLGSATIKHKEKGGAATAAYQAAMDKYIGYSKAKKKKYKYARGVSCSVFVCTVIRATGYDKSWPTSVTSSSKHAKSSSKWKKVALKNAVAGDVFMYKNNGHIYIYGGKSGSKYIWYQANLGAKSGNGDYGYAFYGKSPSSKTNSYAWHATGTVKK